MTNGVRLCISFLARQQTGPTRRPPKRVVQLCPQVELVPMLNADDRAGLDVGLGPVIALVRPQSHVLNHCDVIPVLIRPQF